MKIRQTILLFGIIVICYGVPVTSKCTEDEILLPRNIFTNLVKELQSPYANKELLLQEIRHLLISLPKHYNRMNITCAEEKVDDHMEKLRDFRNCFDKANEIVGALKENDTNTAKDLFASIPCKHVMHFLIAQYDFATGELNKIINATRLMKDDVKSANKMHESIIYTLDDSNMIYSIELLPLITTIINKPNADADDVAYSKLNLKRLAERTLPFYTDALIELNKIDAASADSAFAETVGRVFYNSIYNKAYDVINNAPTSHLKAIGLKALYNKTNNFELQNGLTSSKVLALANTLKKSKDVANDANTLQIINEILENATKFNKNLLNGYSCRTLEQIEYLSLDEKNIADPKYNEYFVLHDIDQPNNFGRVFSVKENGTTLKIDVATKHHPKKMYYSIILNFDDYPKNINLPGFVIAKKRLQNSEISKEELCKMNPKPQYNICIPAYKMLTYAHDTLIATRKQAYDNFKELIKSCD